MTQAREADRHDLYQRAVQDVEAETDFIAETFRALRGREALALREDFCGTGHSACEWARGAARRRAIGIDLDAATLDWGRTNNVAELPAQARDRVELRRGDVRDVHRPRVDCIAAMNFSYYIFLERAEMGRYFRAARDALVDDGILFLDAYGGYEAPKVCEEERDCGDFEYIWEQASFNPINGHMQCYIHFAFPDGSRLERAFSYYWRLWNLPELRELLAECGFRNTRVYWEGTDDDSGEGDGIYTESEEGDADPSWICYLVAEK